MKILFIPECYFDTVLIKKIVKQNDLVWHQKGCNKVVSKCINLKNTFNVGVIDKDKKELKDLASFESYSTEGLNIYFKNGYSVIFIQLNPPIERWILNICEEQNIDLSKFSLSSNVKDLRYQTKSQIVGETKNLNDLCDELLKSENATIVRLKNWIKHILTNFNAIDYNYFKNA
ncbi:MAG TPA: hypothetical protein VG847_16010 [Chitinophagaceae bacterium]|nr:hypothetical protein [Chitinophagaceae bacterium]